MMFAPDLFVEGEICVGYVEVYSGWYRARITQIDHKLQQVHPHHNQGVWGRGSFSEFVGRAPELAECDL